ncbi:PLP-dependent transferase [Flammula alnicola]|nr:PLP-dependent transferase [Flammula alnicola]
MSHTSPSYDPSSPALHEAVSAWFLGPQAENANLLKELFSQMVDSHSRARLMYHPEDGASDSFMISVFITSEIKGSPAFEDAVKNLRQEFTRLTDLLNEKSIPTYSPRYAGHMEFESSLPSMLGWLATMLYNPNNVAFEASPITTLLELDVGMQLCEMLGYSRSGSIPPWGHIACDGTVANLESIWTARNLKFYPLALKEAMCPRAPLGFIAHAFCVHKCASPNELTLFRDLDVWDLLNLRPEEILSIPDRLHTEFRISPTFLDKALRPYIIQTVGKEFYEKKDEIEHPIQYLLSSTKHYSWPKGAALAGIGSCNVIDISVGENARMDIAELRNAIEKSFQERRAIYAVVAIIGSTEEGAVDSLDQIIALRKEYQSKGMSFLVHADAAWGGYFASMITEKPVQRTSGSISSQADDRTPRRAYVPFLALKDHTRRQLEVLHEADSITIDPHKTGYCPFPAGALCYRDSRMRYMVTWSSPYLNQGQNGESIGIYGVEGSKPGAAAAAVYLHHRIVGLHQEGHGSLLGEACLSCARISAHWAAMSDSSTPYLVVPLNKLRAEPDEIGVKEEKDFIRKKIIGRSNNEIVNDADPEVRAELRALGSDLNINALACNFRIRKAGNANTNIWEVNDDVEEANYLNKCIFDRLSLTNVDDNPMDKPLYISSTTFAQDDYGKCLTTFKERLGLETESRQSLFVLRNVVISPFQSAADFAGEIAEIFRRTLVEEMQHVVARNTCTPQEHIFIMQGTDKLFLVYTPLFHKANGRQQLIISAEMIEGVHWSRYVKDKDAHPNETFTFSIPSATIAEILQKETVEGYVYRRGTVVFECTLCNIRVIKHRSLLSKWRDPDYPDTFTPFYLYGTLEEQHIDHMLLRAPNAQLAAENVDLELDNPLCEEELADGLLVYLALNEQSMQPLHPSCPPLFFAPDAVMYVEVFRDPFAAVAHGPGLAPKFDDDPQDTPSTSDSWQPLASGSMRLRSGFFVDYIDLNKQDFKADNRISSYTEREISEEGKAGWRNMVFERMAMRG